MDASFDLMAKFDSLFIFWIIVMYLWEAMRTFSTGS